VIRFSNLNILRIGMRSTRTIASPE
jgi:hypothetical protein